MKIKFIFAIIILGLTCKQENKAFLWRGNVNLPLAYKGSSADAETPPVFNMQSVSKDKKILILNFFAPDCPPCIEELPDLKAYYNEYKSKYNDVEFRVVGSLLSSVAGEDDGNKELISAELLKFINKHNISYPVYLATKKDLDEFNITGYPETFIFFRDKNKEWYLKRKYISAIKKSDLEKYSKNYEYQSSY
ncbi:MAG: TlpA family protein disulfide reductase [Spirochaetia bacterium]|nr:TlpA family protein disulfide reductase [Spirochaetia bacterium]